jgi:hypothetical protein
MLKRMSFDDRDARAMKPRGRLGLREHTIDVVVVVSRAAIFVFEPQVSSGVGSPQNSRRFESHRSSHEVSITATLLSRGKSSIDRMQPSRHAGH